MPANQPSSPKGFAPLQLAATAKQLAAAVNSPTLRLIRDFDRGFGKQLAQHASTHKLFAERVAAMQPKLPDVSSVSGKQLMDPTSVMPKFADIAAAASAQKLFAQQVVAMQPKLPDVSSVIGKQLMDMTPVMPKLPDIAAMTSPMTRIADGVAKMQLPVHAFAGLDKLIVSKAFAGLGQFPAPGVWINRYADLMASTTRLFDNVFRSWSELAAQGLGLVRTFARRALNAALRARQAALRGDYEGVREFLVVWLDISHPQHVQCEAAALVLLQDHWLPLSVEDEHPGLLAELRVLVQRETRNHKMIGATVIRGRFVDSLDRPLVGPDGSELGTVADNLADPHGCDEEHVLAQQISDPRLLWLRQQLRPNELMVVDALAHGAPTWKDAAADAGLTPNFGETVRRRCGRLVAEDRRRARLRSVSAIQAAT